MLSRLVVRRLYLFAPLETWTGIVSFGVLASEKSNLPNYAQMRSEQNLRCASLCVEQGVELARQGQHEEAIEKYKNAIKWNVDCVDAYVAMGAACVFLCPVA